MTDEAAKVERELIGRILSGETHLYSELVERHKQALFLMLVRVSGDLAIAEELTQETFVRAYFNLQRYRGDARFSTWVIRIGLNASHSYFRSRRYLEQRRTQPLETVEIQCMQSDPESQITVAQQQHLVRCAVQALKPKYREVIMLCAFEGMSYPQAAEVLGISVGTVCSRMNRAYHQLRKLISREVV
jgi:RNA polymerase sigma-70 factor, ECF subfamily